LLVPAANSIEATFCDTSKPIWANIAEHGAGPRVDGYMFVTDAVGMQVWLDAGQGEKHTIVVRCPSKSTNRPVCNLNGEGIILILEPK
jgi:hypothetical protein